MSNNTAAIVEAIVMRKEYVDKWMIFQYEYEDRIYAI